MASFPIRQASVLELAGSVIAGLTANPAVYPAPTVAVADLQSQFTACKQAIDRVVAVRAAYEDAVTAKDEILAELVLKTKTDLRYAENITNYDDDKLKLLDWSAPRATRKLTAPGQVRSLDTAEQGEDWLTLDWKKPAAGGKPTAYTIQRREKDTNQWFDIATALKTETKLADQPRHTDLEYRVIAINKAGQSPPSNTVTVVL